MLIFQNMKQQHQQEDVSTGAEVTATGLTQKIIIPKVRYHPTIHIQQPGDGGPAEARTSQTQKDKSAAVHPPKTGTTHADKAHGESHKYSDTNTSQVNPEPSARPFPDRGKQQKYRNQKPAEKLDLTTVRRTVKNPPQTPVPSADLTPRINSDDSSRAPPTPEGPLNFNVMLETDDVKEVEKNTRGQRINPDWFAWRKNRITASIAHRIAHSRFVSGKNKTPPTSYLAAITGTGPNVHTRAMSWGVQMEAEAIRRYQVLKSRALGHAVTVQECGLFIDAKRPWLAASPDGIVTDGRTGRRLLCLEVKCPYKHRERTVEEACRDDRNFCLEIQEEALRAGVSPVYRLKPNHTYYTQIQCQLATSGLQQAELVVFTLKETAIVPVIFDPDMWKETVSRLEIFYRDGLLPYLREKGGMGARAAWTPEQ